MRTHLLRGLILLGAAALLAPGCKKTAPKDPQVTDQAGPGALPVDHPAVDLPATSRGTRRLSIDQLLKSVSVVASPDAPYPDGGGTLSWNYATSASMLRTLGKPDYIYVTDEDPTPSTLYMKFVGDISNDVCGQMISSGHRSEVLMKDVGATDTLQSNPTAVKAHMRWLYLRYFGRLIDPGDDASIQPLVDVFDAVVKAGGDPDAGLTQTAAVQEGWRAVCVAAFSSPQFHIY